MDTNRNLGVNSQYEGAEQEAEQGAQQEAEQDVQQERQATQEPAGKCRYVLIP